MYTTDMSNEDYHKKEGISHSLINTLFNDSGEVDFNRYQWFKSAPKEEFKSFALGTAVHCMVLEPSEFLNRYFVGRSYDLRTKAGKEAKEEDMLQAEGKILISLDQHENISMLANSIMAHPIAKELLSEGQAEMSVFQEFDGLKLKVRPDWINVEKGYIVDVKTTSDFKTFETSILNYNYHVQEQLYKQVCELEFDKPFDFYFLVVSTQSIGGRYPVEVRKLDNIAQAYGKERLNIALDAFKNWIDGTADTEVKEYTLPQWFLRKQLGEL